MGCRVATASSPCWVLSRLDLPQFFEGHGQKAWVSERDQMPTGVDQYATLKVVPTLRGKAAQAGDVRMGRGGSGLHFDAPGSPSPSDDEVYFHLILVPIMPETRWDPTGPDSGRPRHRR
jgi:hypothetical protein